MPRGLSGGSNGYSWASCQTTHIWRFWSMSTVVGAGHDTLLVYEMSLGRRSDKPAMEKLYELPVMSSRKLRSSA